MLEKVPGAKLASFPRERMPDAGRVQPGKLEMEQDWYNSDLKTAALRLVPLDLGPKPKYYNVSVYQQFGVLRDVASSLEMIHEAGFVHRDLRGENILIQIHEGEKGGTMVVTGFLADACRQT